MGFVNYYRDNIEYFVEIIEFFYYLVSIKIRFFLVWLLIYDKVFEILRNLILCVIMFNYFELNEILILDIDVLDKSIREELS